MNRASSTRQGLKTCDTSVYLCFAKSCHVQKSLVTLDGCNTRNNWALDANFTTVTHKLEEDICVIEELGDNYLSTSIHLQRDITSLETCNLAINRENKRADWCILTSFSESECTKWQTLNINTLTWLSSLDVSESPTKGHLHGFKSSIHRDFEARMKRLKTKVQHGVICR